MELRQLGTQTCMARIQKCKDPYLKLFPQQKRKENNRVHATPEAARGSQKRPEATGSSQNHPQASKGAGRSEEPPEA